MVTYWIVTFISFCLQDIVYGFGEDVCHSKTKGDSVDCQFGCCGNTGDKECCDPLAMIVGISIGGVVIVVGIISAIVCCIKHHTRGNRRLTPRQNPNVMTVAQAKPPPYPGQPYQTYPALSDDYKGPMPSPPQYQLQPSYPPPNYLPPEQQVLYSGQNHKDPSVDGNAKPSDTSPPPPYST